MENKKLLSIILKDMTELEEIISEGKSRGNLDELEMEFIHSRARGAVLLLKRALHAGEVNSAKNNPSDLIERAEDTPVMSSKPVGREITPDQSDKVIPEESGLTNRQTNPMPGEKTEQSENYQPLTTTIEDNHSRDRETSSSGITKPVVSDERESVISEESHTTVIPEDYVADIQIDVEGQVNDDGNELVLQEDRDVETAPRLGDSFLKERSVNDLITDHNKLEFKLSNRPVENIQAAIGINDRFQFIRELFDGDGNKFAEVVKTLDSMSHIREAVAYLQHNFRWKKNEASLKFVNLVKRRFPDE